MHLDLLNKRGFGILEIVIASAIIGGTLFAMVSIFLLSRDIIIFSTQKLQASYIVEEGLEVSRFMRDSGWSGNIAPLSTGADYFFMFSTSISEWAISPSVQPPIEGLFLRSFRVENVSRDASANIETTYNAANDDPGTRKVTVKVVWSYKNKNQSITAETYLTDLFGN
ncbi:hypothetical protein A3H65_04230 [Candidatus Giovannonibacteria bacterium RIFCSPLOWO2_02_FULL_45_14]|uniref:Uncharacterized protein n=1 Tax=Candidatus Giovannonibacteria bacterium RIFCSPLOWO2_12_FULL_44_15 TaxID=1798364 RepID=A0A1F5Y0V4_9BACT|nr:MAG: hypothetical protein A3C75_02425 [Candidatus Giovannonibacteria bacterium RIFCSPHIGHO2_02_FULL_44_31]OGF76199.1 MAG: hypothetical protein A3E62_01940 [Candidatus Giovannonibacteria bacterium RIFCSPHIGHO2_12_FULL_44_29]OGF91040.1 MAG: hypothetical protein A3H65_04230 [Candidatus Giovannonibacteria bacterium RIFCSPLOWO2_02_FULL_45_14]OGF93481.1 MAG: hypothetical protein A3G54_01000 [Candidatus Giovannonibacteria bacterium RIFCSPLOWO2_12_FULL_44_15]